MRLTMTQENFLFPSHKIGKLPSPVGGLIFNYDNHSSGVTVRPCEAVYLATHVPVTVLVSASNFPRMQKLYSTLGSNIPQNQLPKLKALKFSEQDLNLTRLLSLMSVDKSDHVPLYMECITSILREMATSGGNKEGLDYGLFKRKLDAKGFTKQQSGSLNQRLDILESFMDKAKPKKWNSMFEVAPGTLTIVDLSDPFVDEEYACPFTEFCCWDY